MSTDRSSDDELHKAIGHFITRWTLLESAMNMLVLCFYVLLRGSSITRYPPLSLDRKMTMLREAHERIVKTMPSIKHRAEKGLELLDTIEKLRHTRDFLVHGVPSQRADSYVFSMIEFRGITKKGKATSQRHMRLPIKKIARRTTETWQASAELLHHMHQLLLESQRAPGALQLAQESVRELLRKFS
jgi:hypothetical protein